MKSRAGSLMRFGTPSLLLILLAPVGLLAVRDVRGFVLVAPVFLFLIGYALYSDSACSVLVTDLTPASHTVVNGLAPDSTGHTFNTAGTFTYYCIVHTYMRAAVTVNPVGSTPGARTGSRPLT